MSVLPFPRGQVLQCADASQYNWIPGTRYSVPDTQHKTGQSVTLLAVRNASGGVLTADNQVLAFGTSAKDLWRNVIGATSAPGVGAVIDDAMPAGTPIPPNAIFYVVLKGPARCKTPASGTINIAAHDRITSAANGRANKAGSSDQTLGFSDQATAANNATMLVHWDVG